MKFTAAESRLFKQIMGDPKKHEKLRNHAVVLSKTLRRELTPTVVAQLKESLPAHVKDMARIGYVQLFVDGKNLLKTGKIEITAHATQDGRDAFVKHLEQRAAML